MRKSFTTICRSSLQLTKAHTWVVLPGGAETTHTVQVANTPFDLERMKSGLATLWAQGMETSHHQWIGDLLGELGTLQHGGKKVFADIYAKIWALVVSNWLCHIWVSFQREAAIPHSHAKHIARSGGNKKAKLRKPWGKKGSKNTWSQQNGIWPGAVNFPLPHILQKKGAQLPSPPCARASPPSADPRCNWPKLIHGWYSQEGLKPPTQSR